jgi:uncharacterized protein DUF3352
MTERDPNQPVTGGTPPGPPLPDHPGTDSPTEAFVAQPHEAADSPAATSSVGVSGPPRPGATRWAVALGVVAVAVGVAAAAAFMLTGQAAPSLLLGYAPADSVVYTELRLDLPGDQRMKVGEFLSRFPGFDDQSTLETKITDVLDRIVREPTDGEQDYSSDIKPWFAGELGMAVGKLPTSTTDASDARAIALVSVSDPAKASAWFKEAAKDKDSTTETYAGTELTTYAGDTPIAFAVGGGKVMLVGDVSSVKAALDSGGKSALATSPEFAAARAAVKGDHLGFMYVDVEAYMDAVSSLAQGQGGFPADCQDAMQAYLPAWMAGSIRAEGDAFAMDLVSPHVAANPITENRLGTVAEHAPPATIFLTDGHETGKVLDASLGIYRDCSLTKDAFQEIETAVGALGGFDKLLGWVGDAGVVVARTEVGIHGGVVIVPTDAEEARSVVTQLRSLATLGGAQFGLEIRDETYQGTTITIVSFSDQVPAVGLPMLPAGQVEIAFALTDDAVIVGADPGFVRASLDAGPGKSLAEDARYRGLIERVGAQNAGVAFVDLTAIRELAEKMAADGGADVAAYEREYKPYLLPFDALVSATVVGELDQVHALIIVK